MPDIAALQETLGVKFKEFALLEQALVHSSYSNENPGSALSHNERLEFLGDAILGLIVAEKLYRDFPAISEGEMTRLRAFLVRRETLAHVAWNIKLGDFLYMGKGEESSGGRNRPANLAGAMEAVIAAVYLDRGMAAAEKAVNVLLETEWGKIKSQEFTVDYKSRLQEIAQSKFQVTPVYRLVSETGPDHDKEFKVEVLINSDRYGSGRGKSKKLAEMEAARRAIEKIQGGFTD
jgi:ribonuclease III